MAESMWPINGPDRLEDCVLRFLAKNLGILGEKGRAKLPDHDFTGVDRSPTEAVQPVAAGDVGASGFEKESSVDPDSHSDLCYHVRPGIYLPKSICDRFFTILMEHATEPREVTYQLLSLFSDNQATGLSQADLRTVADSSLAVGLKLISAQPISELSMPCVWRCLPTIKKMKTLRSLRLEKEPATNAVDAFIQGQHTDSRENIHNVGSQVDSTPLFSMDEDYYKLTCPHLRRLTLHNLQFRASPARDLSFNSMVVASLLSPLEQLSQLSLSMCRLNVEELTCLSNLTNLAFLNLSNVRVNDVSTLLKILEPLQRLQHLDLSQGDEDMNPVIYPEVEGFLKKLVDMLPCLVSLDISGTNLAGFEPPKTVSHRMGPLKKGKLVEEEKCSIPGLEDRQMDFLGLFACAYNACNRMNIPAKKVTGDADSGQVVLAVQRYVDNHWLLLRALNDLFNLFRFTNVDNHRQALEGVLAAMRMYPKDSSIQIAGSASLFYIAKGHHQQYITYQHKREMVNLLLAAMHEHCFDQTMMRNACLTLCHLNLPGDVMFGYERMAKQLLEMLKYDYRDEFIHRLGIFLLNCLACQVDGKEKELIGRLGAVDTMLQIISRKARAVECDDVLEVAWSTLWNVTDETPSNCHKFLTKGGMQLFVSCLQRFKDKPELLRNMMGLMGNIAEVDNLRSHLMMEEYVQIFSDLLESESDGIEVSYNACGVLSHLCFDGPTAWTLEQPTRHSVMERMRTAIKRWPLKSKRNINYRSFEPILRLVVHYDTPIVQHWSCWALCNLTTVSPEKYCRLLECEQGRRTLESVLNDPRPNTDIKNLVRKTLKHMDSKNQRAALEECDGYCEEEEDESAEDLEEEEEGEDMEVQE